METAFFSCRASRDDIARIRDTFAFAIAQAGISHDLSFVLPSMSPNNKSVLSQMLGECWTAHLMANRRRRGLYPAMVASTHRTFDYRSATGVIVGIWCTAQMLEKLGRPVRARVVVAMYEPDAHGLLWTERMQAAAVPRLAELAPAVNAQCKNLIGTNHA